MEIVDIKWKIFWEDSMELKENNNSENEKEEFLKENNSIDEENEKI